MARAKDRPTSAGRRRSPWGRRLAALAAGVVAGVVVGALLADRGEELLPAGRRRRRAPGTPGAPDGASARRAARDDGAEVTAGGAPSRGTGVAAPPAAVEARVLEAFRNDPVLLERPIDIGAIGTGIVELTGWVDSPDEVRHATTLARGTVGVSTVVNRLAIRPAAPDAA